MMEWRKDTNYTVHRWTGLPNSSCKASFLGDDDSDLSNPVYMTDNDRFVSGSVTNKKSVFIWRNSKSNDRKWTVWFVYKSLEMRYANQPFQCVNFTTEIVLRLYTFMVEKKGNTTRVSDTAH